MVVAVEVIAGTQLTRHYLDSAAVGVRGRNAEISLASNALGWEPRTPLREGLRATYAWIAAQGADADSPAE